jgi:hypothetical protein
MYMEEVIRYPVLDAACDRQGAWTDNSAAATAVITTTTSGAVLPFPSFPSSQVNVADLAATRLPGRQTAVLRLLLSSSPLVATVTAVVIEAVVVATAAAVVVVVVKPTITRAGVVGATVVKAVPSSSP